MSTPRQHVRRSASDWQSILTRYERSDLSQRDFCRSEGVALASFFRWRQRLGIQSARRAVSTPDVAREDFVELATPNTTPPWSIEIELPGGCILRLRS